MPADDTLAERLAAIRERFSATNYAIATESPRVLSVLGASTSDVPRLVAAVEAVLALHKPDCEMGVNAVWCGHCGVSAIWPCATGEAITRALTAEDGKL